MALFAVEAVSLFVAGAGGGLLCPRSFVVPLDAAAVCKKTQGFVGFNPLGSEEANISKTETE